MTPAPESGPVGHSGGCGYVDTARVAPTRLAGMCNGVWPAGSNPRVLAESSYSDPFILSSPTPSPLPTAWWCRHGSESTVARVPHSHTRSEKENNTHTLADVAPGVPPHAAREARDQQPPQKNSLRVLRPRRAKTLSGA